MNDRALTARIHRKRDGWLYIQPDGTARYMTLGEALAWVFFRRPPQAGGAGE